jgi:tetratricopeptide (TPR) repeat protein
MIQRLFRSLIVLTVLAGSSSLVPAFGQYREYVFYGKVVDTQKNPLSGVEILLRDVVTSRGYSLKTNKNGEFKFAGLPHGVYKVTFKKEGYAIKEDEWKFEIPQDILQKVEIPTVTLVSQVQIKEAENMKEMQAEVKEAVNELRQGNFDQALSMTQRILEKNPKDTNALYVMGLAYIKKEMWSEAVNPLLEVTGLNPSFPAAYYQLGFCYQQLKETIKSLAFYQKAMELDNTNPDAPYNSGLILFGLSRIDEALAMFERAIALKPDDAEFMEMAGRCYVNRADFPRAISYLEKAKAASRDPDRVKFLDDFIAKLKEQIKK